MFPFFLLLLSFFLEGRGGESRGYLFIYLFTYLFIYLFILFFFF